MDNEIETPAIAGEVFIIEEQLELDENPMEENDKQEPNRLVQDAKNERDQSFVAKKY